MKAADKKIKLFLFFLILKLTAFLNADISFLSAVINKNNEIIFSVKSYAAEGYPYETLFSHSIETNRTRQLTFFPEYLEVLNDGRTLQVSNRFGILRINAGYNKKILDFNPFNSGNSSGLGILKTLQTSGNGKWLTFVEPYSPVYGKLILYDLEKERSFILSEKVERDSPHVSWAPDSSSFLYEENAQLYFARPEWFSPDSVIDKKYRKLGEGSIKNINWLSASSFAYFINGAVYKISVQELFTRRLYGGLFNYGKLIGKIPIYFDSVFDELYISPNAASAVFVHNKRNIYFFEFSEDDYSLRNFPIMSAMPYLLLPSSTAKTEIHWKKNGVPVVLSRLFSNGKSILKIWEMDITKRNFQKINIAENAVFLSSDENFAQVIIKEGINVSFYETQKWKKINSFFADGVISAAWKNSETVFIGSTDRLIEYRLNKKNITQKQLLTSSVKIFSHDKSGSGILAKMNLKDAQVLRYAGNFKWDYINDEILNLPNINNGLNRIYIDSGNGYFKNMIYIRSLSSSVTRPLFSEPKYLKSVYGKQNSRLRSYNNSSIFSNGPRTGKKQVAIIFDAMSNMDGIAHILHILEKHGITATFFINGEAITQNPQAVKEIVKAGHQCGSLFFTAWNFTESGYRIDSDFIRQGLARNEDLFLQATGSELSLIWHTPFYISSPMIISAGKLSGYTFIAPDISVPDWLVNADRYSVPALYKKSGEIIDDIISSMETGSIIPIKLGKADSNRNDYLYMRLELLLNAVIENGYSVVTVSELMQK